MKNLAIIRARGTFVKSVSGVLAFTTLALSALSSASTAEDTVSGVKTKLTLRYRAEYVDQEGIEETALASTLKSRLTFTTGSWSGLSGQIEVDDITVIGSEMYRTPENGYSEYPVVADPEGVDVNQAKLSYQRDGFSSTLGRQRINLGSQRFVGGVGWRQNEQTYDAFRVGYKTDSNVSVDYAYVWGVERVFGPNDSTSQLARWNTESHFITAASDFEKLGKIELFALFNDFNPVPGLSTQTVGFDYQFKPKAFTLNFGYAQQNDYGSNPNNFNNDYLSLSASTEVANLGLSAGYEVLGTDNGVSFKTPLATLHKFQGWADMFLVTPAGGVVDTWAQVKGKVGPVDLLVKYHQFGSDEDSIDYGDELDLAATYSFSKDHSIQLKFAQFDGKSMVDVDKVWLSWNWAWGN
ncbi:hypothetical protein Maes01_02592 [Microbulbifer aestuariivivens]|uniref:Alginate export domain-containing protein n=1 Tax=Microbulbifer aestuariivivens TaxID=1908308 RepID=A0ABP9WS21_9GAMM